MSSVTDRFFEDLQAALTILTTTTVNACCGYPSPFAMFTPPPILLHSGCWCGVTRPHQYLSCPDAASRPRQTIILPATLLGACFHTDEEKPNDDFHSLFCFDVAATTELFMKWFIQQRIFRKLCTSSSSLQAPSSQLSPLPPATLRDHHQRDAIMGIVEEYERRCPAHLSWAPTNLKFNVLCRLLTDLQKLDIPREARLTNYSWDVERVHAVLGWQWLGFDEALTKLATAMSTVAERRYGS